MDSRLVDRFRWDMTDLSLPWVMVLMAARHQCMCAPWVGGRPPAGQLRSDMVLMAARHERMCAHDREVAWWTGSGWK